MITIGTRFLSSNKYNEINKSLAESILVQLIKEW